MTERTWIASYNSGWLIPEVVCPQCDSRILYNGNYFCEFLGDSCSWALQHPPISTADRLIYLKLKL